MKRSAVAVIAVSIALLGSGSIAFAQARVIGRWEAVRETDPFTDESRGYMATAAWDAPSGEESAFGLLCYDPIPGVTEGFTIVLTTSDPFDEGYFTLTYRFDRGTAIRIRGGARSMGNELVILAPGNLRWFITEAAKATNLAIRVGPILTYQFNVTGFAEAYKYVGFSGSNSCPGAPTLP